MDGKLTAEMPSLGLFHGYGIELEYMIVDAETLGVLPVTDQVLHAVAGDYVQEVETGALAWSNELALHVIELKTNGPARTLAQLPEHFSQNIARINELLAPLGGRLMPTAMHPWMDPATETRLWPHHDSPIYQTFDRIFSCRGHGWSNLQSVHINLPFANDREFCRLHAAIRLLLPIMPALAASSPLINGRATGILDNRLDVYRNNAQKIPSVSSKVIPEAAFNRQDYQRYILEPIYHDMAPYDPEGILRYEWVNARGAIARFDRNTIEIRVLDIQECPRADLAIAALISAAARAHTEEFWISSVRQQQWEVDPLYRIFLATMVDADQAMIDDRRYLQTLGFPDGNKCRAGELWQHLIETLAPVIEARRQWQDVWQTLIHQGTLARRIMAALDNKPSRNAIRDVYRRLSDCLSEGTIFGR